MNTSPLSQQVPLLDLPQSLTVDTIQKPTVNQDLSYLSNDIIDRLLTDIARIRAEQLDAPSYGQTTLLKILDVRGDTRISRFAENSICWKSVFPASIESLHLMEKCGFARAAQKWLDTNRHLLSEIKSDHFRTKLLEVSLERRSSLACELALSGVSITSITDNTLLHLLLNQLIDDVIYSGKVITQRHSLLFLELIEKGMDIKEIPKLICEDLVKKILEFHPVKLLQAADKNKKVCMSIPRDFPNGLKISEQYGLKNLGYWLSRDNVSLNHLSDLSFKKQVLEVAIAALDISSIHWIAQGIPFDWITDKNLLNKLYLLAFSCTRRREITQSALQTKFDLNIEIGTDYHQEISFFSEAPQSTLLHSAVRWAIQERSSYSLKIVKQLVEEKGVKIDAVDGTGATALMLATASFYKGYEKVALDLFHFGADIKQRYRDGTTLLEKAIHTSYFQLAFHLYNRAIEENDRSTYLLPIPLLQSLIMGTRHHALEKFLLLAANTPDTMLRNRLFNALCSVCDLDDKNNYPHFLEIVKKGVNLSSLPSLNSITKLINGFIETDLVQFLQMAEKNIQLYVNIPKDMANGLQIAEQCELKNVAYLFLIQTPSLKGIKKESFKKEILEVAIAANNILYWKWIQEGVAFQDIKNEEILSKLLVTALFKKEYAIVEKILGINFDITINLCTGEQAVSLLSKPLNEILLLLSLFNAMKSKYSNSVFDRIKKGIVFVEGAPAIKDREVFEKIFSRYEQLQTLAIETKPLDTWKSMRLALFIEVRLPRLAKEGTEIFVAKTYNIPRSIIHDPESNTAYLLAKYKFSIPSIKGEGTFKKIMAAAALRLNEFSITPPLYARAVTKSVIGNQIITESQFGTSVRETRLAQKIVQEIEHHFPDLPLGIAPIHTVCNYKVSRTKDCMLSKLSFLSTAFDGSVGDLRNCSIEDLLQIAKGVTLGLYQLHLLGYVHADFKKRNCVYRRNRTTQKIEIALIDLGFTFHKSDQVSNTQFRTGYYGSVFYTAPELFGNKNFTGDCQKADLFAFGCMLYENLFHKYPPWSGYIAHYEKFSKTLSLLDAQNKVKTIIEQHVEQPFQELLQKNQLTPREQMLRLMYQTLRFDPSLRIDIVTCRNELHKIEAAMKEPEGTPALMNGAIGAQ